MSVPCSHLRLPVSSRKKIRPEEWESLRADIRGVCFKIKNCIWDTTYDQPLNKPPKMERKIGL